MKVVVAYDGYNYAGWQRQKNALGIQEVIESILEKIHKCPTEIVASGRTDAKVHALGQVFHFKPKENMSCEGYFQALNTLLPKDIRIVSCEWVDDDFHARFSAKKKRYEYVNTYDAENPFVYKYKNVLRRRLDVSLMKEACVYLLGEHDFTSFSSCKIDARKPRVKCIDSIDIVEEGLDVRFVFVGSGFLRYQVRMMSATLIAVGEGKILPKDVQTMLDAKDKHACRFNASAQGLYLMEVYYES